MGEVRNRISKTHTTLVNRKSDICEVFQLNINGINPKVPKQKLKLKALGEIVNQSEYEIPFFILTETHLKDYIFDAEVEIQNYTTIRADRKTRKCGGVAIYSHKSFCLEDNETFSNKYCELALAYNRENDTIIAAIYRPQDASTENFIECLDKIKIYKEKYNTATVLIFGDLNLKFIEWTREVISTPKDIKQTISSEERKQSEILLDFVNEHLLVQVIKENTRKGKSLIDIVLTNDEEIILDTRVKSTYLDTDHDLVECELLLKINNPETTEVEVEKRLLDMLNYEKADWTPIREKLANINWNEELSEEMEITAMYEKLEKAIYDASVNHTPERSTRGKSATIPRNRLILIRKRKIINSRINFVKYVKPAKSSSKLEKLEKKKQKIEDEIKELIQLEIQKKELHAISQMKKNPKFFYSYIKKFMKTESEIAPLQDEEGKLNIEPEKKANLLQSQYTKVFSNPKNENLKKEFRCKCNVEISDIDITTKDIIEAIKDIPTHAAPGPDKIPAVVLKECAEQLSEGILKIWRKSLDTGDIPDILKLQTIIPIYKKGSKTLPENYRPVSLTSHITKLFERILRKKLMKHIEENRLLSDNQHAFRCGRICLSQLLQHMDYVLKALENKFNIDVIYLDFAKAFDKVDHSLLLKKLKSFGITGKLHNWISNFLENRYQQVIVNGKLSRKERVISGVPQGTVLGPLLFLIYINDLEEEMKNCILRVFADDSKLVMKLKEQTDHQKLQEDLDNGMTWAEMNNMQLNQKKFQLMHYGKEENLKQSYLTGQESINSESHVKDLGVHLSEDLSSDTQITEAIKAGRKFMWWILRSFKSRTAEIMLFLYQSYVLPKMEYSSLLWSPYKKKDIAKIETIQRTLTSKIENLQQYNYHQRLRKLKLYSLQRRRERFAALYMYKIHAGLVPNNLQLEFYTTRREEIKCRQPKINTSGTTHLSTVRQHFFTSTGPQIFNLLPRKVKEADTLDSFKRQLDKFLMSIPDMPPTPGYPAFNNNTILEWATGSYNYADVINTILEVDDTTEGAEARPYCS